MNYQQHYRRLPSDERGEVPLSIQCTNSIIRYDINKDTN